MNKKHMKLLLLGILIIFLIVNLKIRENFFYTGDQLLTDEPFNSIDKKLILAIAMHRLFDDNLWHKPQYEFKPDSEVKSYKVGTIFPEASFGGFPNVLNKRELITYSGESVNEKHGIKVIYRKNTSGKAYDTYKMFMLNKAYFIFMDNMISIKMTVNVNDNEDLSTKEKLTQKLKEIIDEMTESLYNTFKDDKQLLEKDNEGSSATKSEPLTGSWSKAALGGRFPNAYATITKIPEYGVYSEITSGLNNDLAKKLVDYALKKIKITVTNTLDLGLLTKEKLVLPKSNNLNFTNFYNYLIDKHEIKMLKIERNRLEEERNGLEEEKKVLTIERNRLDEEKKVLTIERNGLEEERNGLEEERNGLEEEKKTSIPHTSLNTILSLQ